MAPWFDRNRRLIDKISVGLIIIISVTLASLLFRGCNSKPDRALANSASAACLQREVSLQLDEQPKPKPKKHIKKNLPTINQLPVKKVYPYTENYTYWNPRKELWLTVERTWISEDSFEMYSRVTAYDDGECCCGEWADGKYPDGSPVLKSDYTVSADPWLIPKDSIVFVPGYSVESPPTRRRDVGGGMYGNRMEVLLTHPGKYKDVHTRGIYWGVKYLTVRVTIKK